MFFSFCRESLLINKHFQEQQSPIRELFPNWNFTLSEFSHLCLNPDNIVVFHCLRLPLHGSF